MNMELLLGSQPSSASSKIASASLDLVLVAPRCPSSFRDLKLRPRMLAISPRTPIFGPAHGASRTALCCAPRTHGASPWRSWLLEPARDVRGSWNEANSDDAAENQRGRNLGVLDGWSSSSFESSTEACSAKLEATAARELHSDTDCIVCDAYDGLEDQGKYNCGSSSSQTTGNANRHVLLLIGSAALMLGAGLAFNRPAFGKPLASEATITAVGNSETTSKQEGKELADKMEGEASSQLLEESQEASSETANKTEGLGREFWDGFETPDESPELILRIYTEKYPENTQALEALLHLVLEKQDFPRALKILQLLIKLEPDELEWKFMRAQSHECEGELEMAREGFEELLRLRPLSARALQGMIMVLDQAGEEDAALLMVEKALARAIQENKPTEARNLRMLIGQFHTLKGNLGEALKQYEYIIDEDPNDFRPYLCQGIVYSVLGEKDEAAKQFEKFQQLCPKDFPNRSHLDELMKKATHEGWKMYELKQKAFEEGTEGKREPKPV